MKPTNGTQNVMTISMRILLLAAFLISLTGPARAGDPPSQPSIFPMYFTGIVGGDEDWGRRVLLRWYTLEQIISFDSVVIFRTNAANERSKVAVVRRTRDAAVIKTIFYRPGEQRILADAKEMLLRIYGKSGATSDEFAQLVIDMLEGVDATEGAAFRNAFASESNYGIALVEGRGFLDYVDPAEGPFVYEAWQGDVQGEPVQPLGRITIDANDVDPLPAPANLVEVQLLARDGTTAAYSNHRRIYLNWEVPPALAQKSGTTFGYNIYRLGRALGGGETYEDVIGEVVRVNDMPVLPPSPIEDEDATQTYAFADSGDWLETLDEDTLLPVGQQYTYWAVARDLLGQDGLPSNPVLVTVRDTDIPETPRALRIFSSRTDGGLDYLRAQWNTDLDPETVSFNLYRYQEYINAGKVGPFAPVDGLTEGFIASIPKAPPPNNAGKEVYDDFEPAMAPTGRGFWYCVSSVDIFGNESHLSPPAYGVIDDVVGPLASDGRITEICFSTPVLDVTGSRRPQAKTREDTWRPLFVLNKLHPVYSMVEIYERRITPGRAEELTLIAEVPLPVVGQESMTWEDPAVQSAADIPDYRFVGLAADGQSAFVDIAPPTSWAPGSERQIYTVNLDVLRYLQDCEPFPTLEPKVMVAVPGGDVPPFQLKLECTGEIESMRLYRSVDGGFTYSLVKDYPCGATGADVVDNFHPDAPVKVRYSLVAVDKHGNLGTPTFLPMQVLYAGELPSPSLVEVRATGTPANRQALVKWTGPRDGVSYYKVVFYYLPFVVDSMFHEKSNAQEHAIADLDYDESTGEFSVITNIINRQGTVIPPDDEFEIQVIAVPDEGTPKGSPNTMTFKWSAMNAFGSAPNNAFRWAARPLPPVVEKESPDAVFSGTGANGMLVRVEVPNEDGRLQPEPPFMVWRRRTDKPGQPWLSVSPLIDEVHYAGEFLADSFFSFQSSPPFGGLMYFKDTAGHVEGGVYEYYFVALDPISREIKEVVGPVSGIAAIPGRSEE